jgi:hypothetical protein
MKSKRQIPSPSELAENPELAVLKTLLTNLDVFEMALSVVYPEEDYRPDCSQSEQEAYATAVRCQTRALELMLCEYADSVDRLHQWRQCEPPLERTRSEDDEILF